MRQRAYSSLAEALKILFHPESRTQLLGLLIATKYELKELGGDELAKFVLGIPTDVLGFNVTASFKEEIMQFLDSVNSRAKSRGCKYSKNRSSRKDAWFQH